MFNKASKSDLRKLSTFLQKKMQKSSQLTPQFMRALGINEVSMKFIDAFSPTEEELRIWASNPEAEYPVEMSQDWDLILADINYAEILIKLACEESPNKDFFLSCLYILSGASRSDEKAISELKVMLKLVPFNASEDVKLWVKRSENLFNNPALYNYDGWGWGDLAQDKGA